jgi:hypothetical protein
MFNIGSTNKLNQLNRLLKKCFNFKRWGFKQSYSSSADVSFPYVIYNSEWCRVKFLHYGGDYAGHWGEMHIFYGRLHAHNGDSFMLWNNENCWCWHSIEEYALNFLDGLSPEKAVELSHAPRIMEEFRMSEIGKSVHGPEWVARRHLVTWEHYGTRLFELFDLRCPELWEQYRTFLTKVKEIEDEEEKKSSFPSVKIAGHPEIDQVC